MMDSSETGLKSIQYYTDASKKAVLQLNTLGNDLLARPEREKPGILNGVAQMINIGRYFEQAIIHQYERNRKVAAAMKGGKEGREKTGLGRALPRTVGAPLGQGVSWVTRGMG